MIIMWKQILLKDFKFRPDNSSVLGRHSIAEGVEVNLASEHLKNKSEDEMIDMIIATLSHESAHQAFSQVADHYGESVYDIAVYLDELYNQIMKEQKAVPLDEKRLDALVGKVVASAVLDELFAHEAANIDGKGPEHLYFNGYHIMVATDIGLSFDKILSIMDDYKERWQFMIEDNPSSIMREVHTQFTGLHNLIMSLFKRLTNKLTKDIEHKYKMVLMTLINERANNKKLDINDRKIRILLNAVMSGNFELLDKEITDNVLDRGYVSPFEERKGGV